MSGAGRTTALKSLEDIGYEAVDNLPLSLLASFAGPAQGPAPGPAQEPAHGGAAAVAARPLAIGVDIRTRDFGVDPVLDELDRLAREAGYNVCTVFLDCDDDVLLRRYAETRRRHPLDSSKAVPDMIQLERRLLARLRARADVVIDTTGKSPWELKETLSAYFAPEESYGLSLFVTSFAFREGVPRESDLVFDVRFLKNPHYDPQLRPLTGEDEAVQKAIEGDGDFQAFFDSLTGMLEILLPRYAQEGKSYLTIAVGCTGGRHRSVYVARKLNDWLLARDWRVRLHHRDIHGGGGRDML
ncbi:MAG: RNase adapter RapZ [Alphaproteobacteria bacterium]|nr:RNase adapter RapZ [Alphaproteobacteria bacterium]